MAAKGHIRKIEILKDRLIQENLPNARCTPNCECGVGYKVATAIQGLSINEIGQKNFFSNAYRPGEFVSDDGHEPVNFQPPAFILHFFS